MGEAPIRQEFPEPLKPNYALSCELLDLSPSVVAYVVPARRSGIECDVENLPLLTLENERATCASAHATERAPRIRRQRR